MAKATERIFLPVIKAMMPEVIDYDLPLEGVFHNCAIFQIKKEFAGQAFRVMNFAWSMGQMMFTKYVIVVDEDVDCHDYSQVAWRCFNNVDPEPRHPDQQGPARPARPLEQLRELRLQDGHRRHAPLPGEGHEREWPEALEMDARGQGARRRHVGRSSGCERRASPRRSPARSRPSLELVKFEHSIFALPYAYIGALYGAASSRSLARRATRRSERRTRRMLDPWVVVGGWPTLAALLWITVAMVGARAFAFVVNRAVDKEIDARNPRTAGRAIPAGLIKAWELWLFSAVMLAAYLFGVLAARADHALAVADPAACVRRLSVH